MGISVAVGVAAALLLGVASAVRNAASTPVIAFLLYSSVVGFVVAVSSHPLINKALILAKDSRGGYPWWSYIIFFPYLVLSEVYVRCKRLTTTEPLYTEICDGLFVGGWPLQEKDVPSGKPAVVDCTNELPRKACVGVELPYLCIPSWDTRCPSVEDIELAVRWALQKRAQNHPIFIHCAKGHGRSVAVMCALLVALGVVRDWNEGESLIKRHRPRSRLNAAQRKNVQEWRKFSNLFFSEAGIDSSETSSMREGNS